MTDDQAHTLRALVVEDLAKVLGPEIAFVMVMQNRQGKLEILTNAARVDLLPQLLEEATELVRTPPTKSTRFS